MKEIILECDNDPLQKISKDEKKKQWQKSDTLGHVTIKSLCIALYSIVAWSLAIDILIIRHES